MPFFMKKIGSHISVYIIAVSFLLSAILKLRPLEPYEFYLIESHLANWDTVPFISRFFVGLELFIGVVLLAQLKRRLALILTLVLLICFTLYLGYVVAFKPSLSEDCGCFGQHFQLTAFQSILKNLVLMGLCLWALRTSSLFTIPKGKIVFMVLLPLCLLAVVVVDPPDFLMVDAFEENNVEADFTKFNYEGFEPQLLSSSQNKHVFIFLSTSCKMCKLAARKISLFDFSREEKNQISTVYWGNDSTVAVFENETDYWPTRSKVLKAKDFLEFSGKNLPSIVFIENKIGIKKRGFRNLSEQEIHEFLAH